VALAQDGGAVFAGHAATGGTDAFLARVDEKGAKVWQKSFGYSQADSTANVIALTDGGFLASGWSFAGGKFNYQGYALRIDGKGTAVWGKRYGDGTFDGFGSPLAEADGNFLFTGMHGDDGWLLRTDSNGSALTQKLYPKPAKTSLIDVQRHASGAYIVAGDTTVNGTRRGWLALVHHDDLSIIWQKTFGQKNINRLTGITLMGAGGLVLTGRKDSGPDRTLSFVGTGPLGDTRWQRDYAAIGGQSSYPRGAVRLPDGTLCMITNPVGKKGAPHLLRADAWGETDCAKSGVCAGLSKSGCDDSDPCTADVCAPVGGCGHTAIAGCKAATDIDLEHDGLVGKADPCPTVWTPDSDPKACAPWGGKGWTQAQDLKVGQPGLATGLSTWRRTNEPAEVPLVNGIVDDSVVGYWKLDGDFQGAPGQPGKGDKTNGPRSARATPE